MKAFWERLSLAREAWRQRKKERAKERLMRSNKEHLDALAKWLKTEEFIASMAKKSKEGIELHKYGLGFAFGATEYGWREPYPQIYWETRHGYVLTYEERPIACIGFICCRKGLLIRQIQGISGEKEALSYIHWEKLLCMAVVEHALAMGLPEVVSIQAKDNPYYCINTEECSRTQEDLDARRARMEILYNKTPRKCGFAWSEKYNMYLKTI